MMVGTTDKRRSQAMHLLSLLRPEQREVVEQRKARCGPCSQNQKLGVVTVQCKACGCAGVSLIHGRCKLRKWPAPGTPGSSNGVAMPPRPNEPEGEPSPPEWMQRPAVPHSAHLTLENIAPIGSGPMSAGAPSGGGEDIFIYGFPGLYAGANTELHHQVILWRLMGLTVHLIPGGAYRNEPLYPEMIERGVIVHEPNQFDAILPGAPVLGFCNDRFLARIDEILLYSHNTVFVNCMTWLFDLEKRRHREGKIAAFLYQNEEVRQKNMALLREINPDPAIKYLAVKPYFDAGAFPFVGEEPSRGSREGKISGGGGAVRPDVACFTIGRISRADADKFSADTVAIWEGIEVPGSYAGGKRGIMLGFGRSSEEKLGGLPPEFMRWVKTFKNQTELSQQDFYRQVDVIVQPMDTTENWPRIGLEAMASGAVLIVDNRGGWRQMVKHGVTGWLCDTPEDFIKYATRMAHEPQERAAMARSACGRLGHIAGQTASAESWGDALTKLCVSFPGAGGRAAVSVRARQDDCPKIIVGALSCLQPQYAERRAKCQRTWLPALQKADVEVLFLVGVGDGVDRPVLVGPEEHGRIGMELHLPCPDDYASLPQKTRWFCRWAIENRSFDYLFK